MPRAVPSDTLSGDIAVNLKGVTKEFVQWQRTGQFKDIVKNLVRPEKKVVRALNHLDLEIRKGEFVAYAGANGAGKSTTIKILSGIMQPTVGDVAVLDMCPAKARVELMKRIGIVFGQRTELWWDHPVVSSLEWKKVVWAIPDKAYRDRLAMITDLLDLGELLKTYARELSLGQRMRADLALMLLHSPELIFLDEPTLGLDVLAKRQMIDFLKRINKEEGTTIVVTSHDMDDLEEMAQRIVLLSKGELAFDGSFDQLRKIAGGMCRIRLTLGRNGPPEIKGGRLLSGENSIYEYEFDTNLVSVPEVLAQIALVEGVIDVEINKAPIEQVVAELYTKWKGETA